MEKIVFGILLVELSNVQIMIKQLVINQMENIVFLKIINVKF